MHNIKRHYWIIFIFVLFAISYLNYLLAIEFQIWSATLGIFANVLIFLVVIIPFTAYLSNQIHTFTLSRNIQEKSAFKFLLLVLIVLPVVIVSLTIYNEYKEKSLINIIGYDSEQVESLEFHLDGSKYWRNTNEEAIEELFDFLSQYNVKKISNNDWNSDVSKVLSFRFTMFTKNDVIAVSIHEDRLSFHGNNNSGYYSVINGPVNTQWVKVFNEKYNGN
ncbi:hypothetical protein [Ornithinibacillus xuwenensis]|uniref:Uncharacterized protein n=1 Tax=Ornithinibacillus xuwenensis TaxID=3144668 RepID=A0ABU9XEQ7_9BACI